MPGRQYTAPASSVKQKGRQKSQKRSLNALAIAEKQAPQKQRIRPSRLGKVEDVSEKRKRVDEDDEGFDDQENGQRRSKRAKEVQRDRHGEDIEEGSDSDGHNWRIGVVDSDDDDSDLDSDEALGASDEERFDGFVFRGSSAPKKKVIARNVNIAQDENGETGFNVDLNEDSGADYDEEESDDFRENAVD